MRKFEDPGYKACPFCGSDAVGPIYWDYTHNGVKYLCTAIGCAACGSHGPVRNDYPENPVLDVKSDEIEDWTQRAWNRDHPITPQDADAVNARHNV